MLLLRIMTGEPNAALLDHIASAPRRESGDVSRRESGDVSPMRLQRLLDRLGYDVSLSGVMDARTEAAIRAYEQDHNLLLTGQSEQGAAQAHAEPTWRPRERPCGAYGG